MNSQNDIATIMQQLTDLLKKTTEMTCYIDLLKILKSEYLIVLSLKDTAGSKMSPSMINQIRELGFSKFDIKLWLMYAGIIYKSEVLLNKSGEKPEIPVFHECDISGCNVYVGSEPFKKGNRSSISINGTEYAINKRGLNIVVYDTENNKMIDSVTFDCHNKATGVFTRKEHIVTCRAIDMESTMIQINDKLDAMSKKIELNNYKMNYVFWNHSRMAGETSLDAKKRFFKSLQTEDYGLSIWQKASTILLSEFGKICEENGIDYWLNFGTLVGAVRHNGFVPWDDDIDVGMMRKDVPKFKKALSEADTCMWLRDMYSVEPPNRIFNIGRVHFNDPLVNPFLDIFIYDNCDSDSNERWQKYKANRESYVSQLAKFRPTPTDDPRVSRAENFAVTNPDHIEEIISITNKILESDAVENGDYIIWGIDNFSFPSNKKVIYKTSDIFPLKDMEFNGKLYKVPNQYEKYLEVLYGDIYSLPNDMLTHQHVKKSQDVIEKCKEMVERYYGKI